MSAIACDIRELGVEEIDLHDTTFFSRGVSAQPERRCPHCNSVIYSRRHKLCGVCAEPLPAACLFSMEQAQSVKSLMNEERERHRVWLHRFEN